LKTDLTMYVKVVVCSRKSIPLVTLDS
jgi:hypothetical protein